VQIVFAYGPTDATAPQNGKAPSFLAAFKSRLVLPLWYRLTQVVLEKWPLNACSIGLVVVVVVVVVIYLNISGKGAQATYMPVKSSTMNMLLTVKQDRIIEQ